MYFESGRQFRCRTESSGVLGSDRASNHEFLMTLRSRAHNYCHGEKSLPMVTATPVVVPKPAPRMSRNQLGPGVSQSSQFIARFSLQTTNQTQAAAAAVAAITQSRLSIQNTKPPPPRVMEPKILIKNTIHPLGIHKFEGSKHIQASEETNSSSSDDDTEDSTAEAKQDKPKVRGICFIHLSGSVHFSHLSQRFIISIALCHHPLTLIPPDLAQMCRHLIVSCCEHR